MPDINGEARRIFQERLPEAAKADQALHALILDAWDQATPPAPPVVLVQREDFADGSPTEYVVIDRRQVRGARELGRFRAEVAARALQLRNLPISGGAINLAAVDTDEYFHDTDYELLGNQTTYSVISGCDVTFDAANMTLDIAAGLILHNGLVVTVAAQLNALTLVADGSNERWAYVTLDSAGSAVLVTGDAAASSSVEPTKPELGDRVLLYMVKIQAAQTIAANAEYKLDKRVMFRGGRQLVGRQTTEATTAAGSAVDLITISGLNIPVTSAIEITFSFRKTAGAATVAVFGLKLNSTSIFPGVNTAQSVAQCSGTNQAEDGSCRIYISPRQTNYLNGVRSEMSVSVSATGISSVVVGPQTTQQAPAPAAAVTSVVIIANSGSVAQTAGVRDVAVYEVLH